MSIIFVDTETTGLDPDQHEVWEIALIEEDGTEHEWRIKPSRLRHADPGALRVNHLYERIDNAGSASAFWTQVNRNSIAWEVARLTAGKHLVGAVPSFDEKFLTKFLDSEGYAPAWHYHLIDTETLAAGRLGLLPPWDSDKITAALSIADPAPDFGPKHTAIADARWAKWMYETVFAQYAGGIR